MGRSFVSLLRRYNFNFFRCRYMQVPSRCACSVLRPGMELRRHVFSGSCMRTAGQEGSQRARRAPTGSRSSAVHERLPSTTPPSPPPLNYSVFFIPASPCGQCGRCRSALVTSLAPSPPRTRHAMYSQHQGLPRCMRRAQVSQRINPDPQCLGQVVRDDTRNTLDRLARRGNHLEAPRAHSCGGPLGST